MGITSEYGPRASLPMLRRLQQESRVELSVNDHDVAHAVGRETAKNFGANFRAFDLCPTSFNYGCPHGFFEYVLARSASPRDAATQVCESIGGNRLLTAGFSCYHGVGHGVMMAEAYDVQQSLATCNTLPKANAQQGCWQGVFMENVNGAMTRRARKGVFDRRRPLAPCDRLETRYRHECFINHAGWLMTVAGNRVERASRYCLAVKGADRTACLQSIGLMVTNPVWQATLAPNAGRKPQHSIAWELCARFPAVGRRDCVVAGIDNLANFDNLKLARQRSFCEVVPTTLRSGCHERIGVNLRGRTTDHAVLESRCGELGRGKFDCLRGAGLAT